MNYRIENKEHHVEIYASGHMSTWDALKAVFELYINDPHKERPDIWILSEDFELSLASFSGVIQGILNLVARNIKKGCRSAIVAHDEFQRITAEMYCDDATAFPYDIKVFTNREAALKWVHHSEPNH